MAILKKIAISFAALIFLIVIWTYTLPAHWTVTRSAVIHAAPETIYPLVADFKNGWPKWSSFDYEDPNIHYSYAGPDSGMGASRSWTSAKMGDGGQKITQADPKTGIAFELTIPAHNVDIQGSLSFIPQGSDTQVTWTDQGDAGFNPMKRFFGKILDGMMGPSFVTSLANLKKLSESQQIKSKKS